MHFKFDIMTLGPSSPKISFYDSFFNKRNFKESNYYFSIAYKPES